MKYKFRAKIWKYQGKAGWFFLTLPKPLAKKIKTAHGNSEEGWGRLKTNAQVGKSIWKTSIWYDTKANSYLLPVKSEIRKKEMIKVDTILNVSLHFESNSNLKNSNATAKPSMWR